MTRIVTLMWMATGVGCSELADGEPIDPSSETESSSSSNCSADVVYDDDGDGITDRTTHRNMTKRRGLTAIRETDFDAAGTPTSRTRYVRRPDQAPVEVEFDYDADGVIDSRYTFAYDEEGRVVGQRYDRDGDGPLGFVRTVSTFAADGTATRVEQDTDDDGMIDYAAYTTTIDPVAHTLTEEFFEGPGQLVGRDVTSLDESGRKLETKHDLDADGVFDMLTVFTSWVRNSSGSLHTVSKRDSEYDGVFDGSTMLHYNSRGLLETEISLDAEGRVKHWGEIEWLPTGRQTPVGEFIGVTHESGFTNDGYEWDATFRYDEQGREVSRIADIVWNDEPYVESRLTTYRGNCR